MMLLHDDFVLHITGKNNFGSSITFGHLLNSKFYDRSARDLAAKANFPMGSNTG